MLGKMQAAGHLCSAGKHCVRHVDGVFCLASADRPPRLTQDFACTRCPQACERFVDVLGLKTLFSIFMGKSKV
jgi:hypothetical protein